MPKHVCELCGQISFSTYREYEKHRTEAHNMKTEVKAENVSGRSFLQIVSDAEDTWLKPHLIRTDVTMPIIIANNDEHLPACHCPAVCLQKKLDALIASQELSLINLNNGGCNAE